MFANLESKAWSHSIPLTSFNSSGIIASQGVEFKCLCRPTDLFQSGLCNCGPKLWGRIAGLLNTRTHILSLFTKESRSQGAVNPKGGKVKLDLDWSRVRLICCGWMAFVTILDCVLQFVSMVVWPKMSLVARLLERIRWFRENRDSRKSLFAWQNCFSSWSRQIELDEISTLSLEYHLRDFSESCNLTSWTIELPASKEAQPAAREEDEKLILKRGEIRDKLSDAGE